MIKTRIYKLASLAVLLGTCFAPQVQAGYGDMPMELTTREQHKHQSLPAEKSIILKGVKFFNPKTIANNVYFQQADEVADTDMLRAAHWLVSIVYEADNNDSEDVNILCSDACRALVVLHEAIAEKETDPLKKFTHLMYAAISADIGAFSLANHRADSFVMSGQAFHLYQKAQKYAELSGLVDPRLAVLASLIKESDSNIPNYKVAAFIERRTITFRELFNSTTDLLHGLHNLNITDLKTPSPLQQIERAIQKASSKGDFDEVAKLSAQRNQLLANRNDDDA